VGECRPPAGQPRVRGGCLDNFRGLRWDTNIKSPGMECSYHRASVTPVGGDPRLRAGNDLGGRETHGGVGAAGTRARGLF